MRKDYGILKVNNCNFKYFIFSLDAIDIFNKINEIENEIPFTNSTFLVIFDTLLLSGNTDKRYISAKFSHGKFDLTSFEIEKVKRDDYVRLISTNFFNSKQNYELISNTPLLNSIQKKIINKGLAW